MNLLAIVPRQASKLICRRKSIWLYSKLTSWCKIIFLKYQKISKMTVEGKNDSCVGKWHVFVIFKYIKRKKTQKRWGINNHFVEVFFSLGPNAKLRIRWLYPQQRVRPRPQRGILDMTLNCIWWWSPSSGDQGSVEYPFISILPSLLTRYGSAC